MTHVQTVSPFSRKMVGAGRAVQVALHCRLYAGKPLYTSIWTSSGTSRKNDGTATVIQKGRMLTLLIKERVMTAIEGGLGSSRRVGQDIFLFIKALS